MIKISTHSWNCMMIKLKFRKENLPFIIIIEFSMVWTTKLITGIGIKKTKTNNNPILMSENSKLNATLEKIQKLKLNQMFIVKDHTQSPRFQIISTITKIKIFWTGLEPQKIHEFHNLNLGTIQALIQIPSSLIAIIVGISLGISIHCIMKIRDMSNEDDFYSIHILIYDVNV